MTNTRISYLLTCNPNSKRAKFSKNILEKIGFNVNIQICIPNDNKVLSNKLSMIHIYEKIANGNDEWVYVFEDDINILEDITLDEIIEYEKISETFFYLGCCCILNGSQNYYYDSSYQINKKNVITVKGNIRGLHAIALSKEGAQKLLNFIKIKDNYIYMDVILEQFSEIHPANVVRFDLESYIHGHRGIFFQDRKMFPSEI